FLIFKRDQVSQVIILEDGEDDATHITAILPPDEEVLSAIINGWTTYNQDNSELLSNAVNAIAFDGQGKAWIGSETTGGGTTFFSDGSSYEEPVVDGGISVFDGSSWKRYSSSDSELLSNDVRTLNVDASDQVWINTNEGLQVFDGENWTIYSEEDYDLGFINEINIDKEGKVWLSGSNELSVHDGQEWDSLKHLHPIIAFDKDLEGRLLITTGESVYAREGKDWIELFTSENEPNNPNLTNIVDLQFDSIGRLWIVTENEGLKVFNGKTWESYFPEDNGLDIGYIEDMEIDHLDRIWLVSFFGGVYMFDPAEGWYDYTPDPIGISVEYPQTMEIDQDGRIWIGSRHGIAVFTPQEP
ncbi:two-component regulator propeller domain-containing protein, partial [Chloroflexota bacterium]